MASKNPAIFYGAIVLALIFLALCVFYALPGVSHPLVSHDPTQAHPTHALLFGVLTVLSIIAALITRPKSRKL